MSNDGATMGISAERAIATILGGDPAPGEDENESKEAVSARIVAAIPNSYGGAADCIARAMLRVLTLYPQTRDYPLDRPTAFAMHGTGETIGTSGEIRIVKAGTYTETDWKEYPETVFVDNDRSLWDEAKKVATDDEKKAMDDSTGFMVGFAYNQARWLVGLPSGPNPAFIKIG